MENKKVLRVTCSAVKIYGFPRLILKGLLYFKWYAYLKSNSKMYTYNEQSFLKKKPAELET